MSHLINKVYNIISSNKNNEVFIVGIDGPIAAGKTTLANNIEKKFKDSEVFIFKLDWTLKDRKFRENSLKDYKKIIFCFILQCFF